MVFALLPFSGFTHITYTYIGVVFDIGCVEVAQFPEYASDCVYVLIDSDVCRDLLLFHLHFYIYTPPTVSMLTWGGDLPGDSTVGLSSGTS